MAFVRVDGKWGTIDTNGRSVISPRYDEIKGWGPGAQYFFFMKEVGKTDKWNIVRLVGVAAPDGSVMVPPIMDEADRAGFQHGLLKCTIKGKQAYVNTKGAIVWQEDTTRRTLSDMDIDYKNYGDFLVAAKGGNAAGYLDALNIYPQKIDNSAHFPPGQLSISVRTDERDTFRKVYNGIKVHVANTTPKAAFFPTDGSRLEMKVQALDQHGNWRDIEYVTRSGCGNTYSSVSLDPGEYWTFVSPVYKGGFKTKLRIALDYFPNANAPVEFFDEERSNKQTIYSNAYDGSVNPAQFWRSRGSYTRDRSDPYGN